MKICYVYLNNLEENNANTKQSLSMVCALAHKNNVTLVSGWISAKKIKERLDFFSLPINFNYFRLPLRLSVENLLTESLIRFFYAFLSYFFVLFSNCEYIYTRDFSFILFLSFLPKFLQPKKKIIFEQHIIYHLASKKVSFNFEKRALEIVDFFVPISHGVREDLISLFRVSTDIIKVLPDGFDSYFFKKVKKNRSSINARYKIKKNDKLIIYTGSFKEWKGVDVLVQAVKFVDHDFKLLLAGPFDNDFLRIKKLIEENKLNDKILIEKYLPQNEIVQLLKSADLAILPNIKSSIGERYTSPLKLFEYLAAGIPIISSNLLSMREILSDGENCLFFNPGDHIDLAKKINTMLNDVEMMKKLSGNNLKISEKFGWDVRAKKIIEIINSIK